MQQLVVQLLGDKKLEVQELAARTLSGLIQVCQKMLFCHLPQCHLDRCLHTLMAMCAWIGVSPLSS